MESRNTCMPISAERLMCSISQSVEWTSSTHDRSIASSRIPSIQTFTKFLKPEQNPERLLFSENQPKSVEDAFIYFSLGVENQEYYVVNQLTD